MHPRPSCASFGWENICRRASYGEERRNVSTIRATLGPFPDECILSGLDKILYFCGIKNLVQLTEKFPFANELFDGESSSDSSCDKTYEGECIKLSKDCEKKTLSFVPSSKSLPSFSVTSNKQELPSFESLTELSKHLSKVLSKGSFKEVPIAKISEMLESIKQPQEHSQVSQKRSPKRVSIEPCSMEKAPKIVGTRWAMARINIFSDCSRTYEILEIRGRMPKAVIPCRTAVFFAVLPNGSTICYDYVKPRKK